MGQVAARTTAPTSAPSVAAPAPRAAEPAPVHGRTDPSFSGGSPIVPSTRSRMESAFGRSFEGVRVHTDGRAASFARDHQAEAVTVGQDIAFGTSRYSPGTESGDRLIAHELSHVVQQGSSARGAPRAKSEVSTPNEPAEVQADAAAGRVMSGQPAGVTEGGYAWSTRNRLMRKALSGAGTPTMSVPVPVPATAAEAASNLLTRKRKKPDAVDAGAAPEKGDEAERGPKAGDEERREAPADVKGEERPQGEGREDTTEEADADRKKTAAARGAGAGLPGGGLVGRLVAHSLRATEGKAGEKPAASPGTKEAGQRAEAPRKVEEVRGEPREGKAASDRAAGDGAKAGEPMARGPERAAVDQAAGASAKEGEKKRGEAGAEGKEEKKPLGKTDGKEAKGKGREAPGGEAKAEGEEAAPGGARGPRAGLEAQGKGPGVASGDKGAQEVGGKGGEAQPGAKAAVEAKAKAARGGDIAGLKQPSEKGPADAGAGGGEREPAAAGGGGGGSAAAGGGGGGEGGAESPEAQATEEKLDEKQPEEEKAAEAQQDGEEEAAEGGGGEGEAEAEPAAGGGEGAGPEPAVGGGGDAEGASPEAASDAGGGAPSAAEKQVEAKNASAMAEAERNAEEERQAEAEEERAQEQAPEAAGAEEGQLAPAERDAATASVSEDAGGGAGGDAGGGGGGGGAIADKPAPEAPDVSGSEPKAALGSLKGQAPIAIKGALGGVSQSVSTTVGDRKQELAANPPTRAASTGMPGKTGRTQLAAGGGGKGEKKVEKVPEGAAVETPAPGPVPEAPPAAVNAVSAPATSGGGEGEMSQSDAAKMDAAIENMPTSDPGVDTSAGPPPTVALEGNADPAQVTAQRAKLDKGVAAAHERGKADAAEPMGEDEIAPQAADGMLAAKVPGGAGGAGGGASGGGASPDEETASIIAQEKSQGEIDAAVDKGQGDMAQEEEKEKASSEAEEQRTQEEAAKAEAEAEAEQRGEKAAAKDAAAKKRGEWTEAQQAAVDKAHGDADEKQTQADEKVQTEKTQADEGAGREIRAGEEKARTEKREGEAKAEREKAKAKEESSGFFGWLASKAKAFFDKIKAAVKSIVKALREAVKAAIEAAKKAAVALIEKARQAIVAAIRFAGDALIAISDVALAAFPEAKAKFQRAIREKVQAAEDAVNNIADSLKKGVTALLDALGDFLDKALGLLEKALLAIVDAVGAAVNAAIKAAEAVAKALGTFIVLIKDIAAGPGRWIANLGAAVVDGIKNHLVKAMKSAISEWFQSKVEEVLGLPIDLMKALFKGGFNLAAIGKMAWEALKSAIPAILVQLLIEKLVAMVVPAAGAVMAIIEGLQAAWGAVSRIIAAIDKFVTFLKAVKGGGAGPAFATAVAAAAVAVIDFVANWLLKRLIKPAKKVAGKLAGIAKKILAKITKGLKKVGKKIKKGFKKLGKGLKKLFKGKKKGKGKDKKKDKKRERIEKAQRELPPKVAALLSRKPSKLRLKAQLLVWRVTYRLRSIRLGSGDSFDIDAQINPNIKLGKGWTIPQEQLLQAIDKVAERLFDEASAEGDARGTGTFKDPIKLTEKETLAAPALAVDKNPDAFFRSATVTVDGKQRGVGFAQEKGNFISEATPHWKKASDYDELKGSLKGKPVGDALTQMVRDKSLPEALAGARGPLGELHGLWMGKEPQRQRRDLVYSLMLTQMMSSETGGKTSFAQALKMHPAVPKGAQQGARGVNALMKGEKWQEKQGKMLPATPEQNRNTRLKREKKTIIGWFKMMRNQLPVRKDKPTQAEVEELVYTKLKEFFARRPGGV
ncbi:eCIS core domain-containing protein [Sorangium sp. So ce1335]|uniref:eCIS core domain-containing protein n=1 Tax=Sorangium sp. So ce1335 TaxID=3133335 RepID=UPI003F5FF0A9